MNGPRAATLAKELISRAACTLHTANAADALSRVLEEALPYPAGHHAYRGDELQPMFAETGPHMLAMEMQTGGPGSTPRDRIESSTEAMSDLIGRNFGGEALSWFLSRAEPARDGASHTVRNGTSLSSVFDRNGLSESMVRYAWGPELMDALPGKLYQIARIAAESLPGLRPTFSAIRCGRTSGSQHVTFEIDQALPLNALKPVMDNLGLGHQHAGLMSACAFLLGARFTLPPGAAAITLRPCRTGVEMRLDVNLDMIGDVPPTLVPLLRMQIFDRPQSMRALDRWISAWTPEGYNSPGCPSVLSLIVRPDMPARIALYLKPSVLQAEGSPSPVGTESRPSVSSPPVAAAPARAESLWAPSPPY